MVHHLKLWYVDNCMFCIEGFRLRVDDQTTAGKYFLCEINQKVFPKGTSGADYTIIAKIESASVCFVCFFLFYL
jgi:hypothetical protein